MKKIILNRQTAIITLVFLTLLAIFLLFINKRVAPKIESPNLENYRNYKSGGINASFTGLYPKNPSKISVFQNQQPAPNSNAIITNFLKQTGQTIEPEDYQTPSYQDMIFYNNNHPPSNNSINDDQLIDYAINQLTQLGYPITKEDVIKNDYLSLTNEPYPTTKNNASAIQVSIAPAINKIPLYYANQLTSTIQLMIDTTPSIIKLIAPPLSLSLQETGSLKPISIDDAISNINHQNFTIISSANPLSPEPNKTDVVLNKTTLEYRYVPETNQVVPYYRFSGHLNSDSQNYIQIITPAIPTQ